MFLAQVTTTLSGLNTPLGQVMGFIVKLAFVVGLIMLVHGFTMDHSNGQYKHVLFRAACVMGAATFVAVLFTIFFPGNNPIQVLFQ